MKKGVMFCGFYDYYRVVFFSFAHAGETPQIIVQTEHSYTYDFAISPDGMWLAVLGEATFGKTTCKIYNIKSKRLFGE